MLIRFEGGTLDGRVLNIEERYISSRHTVTVPYIENQHDMCPKSIEDLADPDKWEPHPIETWRMVRKDRPRFGRITYAFTGETDADGHPVFS